MRAGAKRERWRAQGAYRALGDARYLDFDRSDLIRFKFDFNSI